MISDFPACIVLNEEPAAPMMFARLNAKTGALGTIVIKMLMEIL